MPKLPPEFILPSVPRVIELGDTSRRAFNGEAVHSYARIAARLERAIKAVSDRIRVDPNSRVARWSSAINRLAEANKRSVLEQIVVCLQQGQWKHPFRDSFLALGESRMFVEIIEQLVNNLTDRDLRELVSGHCDPSLDKPSARGRDKEFEWFVAALLRRGGLPIALDEPDVLIKFREGIRSIAAKRLSSRRQLDSNIKTASRQILEAGYPGYIFVDVTHSMDPELQFMAHWRYDSPAVLSHMNAIGRKAAVTIRRNALVQGAFVRAAFPLVSPGFVYGTSEEWMGVHGGDKDEHIELMDVLLCGARGV